jgi:hypothetical protein
LGIIKIHVFSTSGFTGFDVVRIALETTLRRAVIIVPSATCATLPFKVPSLRVSVIMSSPFDVNTEIIFETQSPVMFSALERKLGLSVQWKPWKARAVSIGANSTLMYRKADGDSPISGILALNKVIITEMSSHVDEEAGADHENGIVVACQDMQGYDTSFRCVLSDDELLAFKEAIRAVAKEHNVDNLHRNSITEHLRPESPTKVKGSNHSVMRRAVARAMDLYDVRSIKERTIARRGAMKYLPVLFSNDLVHGSWYGTSTLLTLYSPALR